MRVYLVGVGPGDPEYITERVKRIVERADIIIGYRYTLNTIKDLTTGKDIRYVTLKTQEEVYESVLNDIKDSDKVCVIPFTGDINFSESEIVDRVSKIFGSDNIIIEPGISSIQVAASRSKVALDKCSIITFHITGSIEEEKKRLLSALRKEKCVILLPRPWDFMPKDIGEFLSREMDISRFDVDIYENLTTDREEVTRTVLNKIPEKEYSDLSVMVIKPR